MAHLGAGIPFLLPLAVLTCLAKKFCRTPSFMEGPAPSPSPVTANPPPASSLETPVLLTRSKNKWCEK